MLDANEKIRYFENILLNKYNFRVIKRLLKLYRDNGYYQKGIDFCKKLIESDPNNAGFISDLGRLYLLTGQLDLAENTFLKALKLDPNNIFAYQNLAAFYLREKSYDKAKPLCIYLMKNNKMLDFELADLFKIAKYVSDAEMFEHINSYVTETKIIENKELFKYKFESLVFLNKFEEAEKIIELYQTADDSKVHYASKIILKKARYISDTKQVYAAIDYIRNEIVQDPKTSNVIKCIPSLCKSKPEIQYAINMINEFGNASFEQCIKLSTIANLHFKLEDYESERIMVNSMDYYCRRKYLAKRLNSQKNE
jgi:tetratricopeptide (TPR) repeat protein